MRVVVPFTNVHPLADTAVQRHAPHAERVYVGDRDDSYWRLLSGLWADGEAFVVIEHDIEIHATVLEAFAACTSPWCTFGYLISWGDAELLTRGLGCVRFGVGAMAMVPDATTDPDVLGAGGDPSRDWRRLDTRIAGRLSSGGLEPCVHGTVVHHHIYGGHCACGREHS